jgi:hypothetical protein
MEIGGKAFKVQGRIFRMARLAAEGFEFIESPEPLIASMRAKRSVDLFTFMQRLPHISPEYSYPMEWDNLAALPISTFDSWWNSQISGKTRNMVRRAEKKGVIVREVRFDDELVKGIYEIYNECPIRQGRPFPHYGKDEDVVRRMSATFMDSSVFLAAFLDSKIVGFAKLTMDEARSQAAIMHIVGMIKHRDKSLTNALIAQAVRSCESRKVPYLVYSNFSYGKKQRDTLADFKDSNGFQRLELPRYYVPITSVGALGLRLGLHHRMADVLPGAFVARFRELRNAWYNHKLQSLTRSS